MRDILTSPRSIEIKHNRRVRKLRLVVLYFLLFVSVIYALSFFSSDKHIVINNVIVDGTHVIDKDKIEKEVYRNLSGKYMYLFSKANSFIYPHDKIYDNLILNFPRIASLSINRDNFQTLHIRLTERVGSSLYCGEKIPENKNDVGENCYFINADGYIFDKAPYFSGNVYFKYYTSILSKEVDPLGKGMMNMDQFHTLARFIDGVVSLGFNPIYIFRDSDGTSYLYLDHKDVATSPRIIFKSDDNIDLILDNLSVAMQKREFADEINSKYNTLLYIDLRFDNKVLYKFE